jgi:hypothetical protein
MLWVCPELRHQTEAPPVRSAALAGAPDEPADHVFLGWRGDGTRYNFEDTYPKFKQHAKALEEFRTYIERNRAFIPNYGERYHHGERISTGFVESTVNQVVSKRFCKKQQMQ